MVKIVNTLGDVKIGRQGEVVYQRKYGEQIRRLAAPKRAIPSQVQLSHRDLYKTALAWRSGLSLPNRRYLDGYCIANWVVDKYKIPLPWSRFALKLYLQAIKFVVIEKAVAGVEGEEGRFEWYDDYNGWIGYRYSHWGAQSFTPSVTHNISKVRLRIYRTGNTYDDEVILSIRATDGSGHPTGEDIVAKVISTLDIPTAPPDWIDFPFATNPPLQASTKYAIVIRSPGIPFQKYINVGRRTSAPTYEFGEMLDSTNSGTSWTPLDQEWSFEEYGISPGIEGTPGLLHVRHPSLMSVVHKRGDVTLTGYDTLSSLDDEYLTGQVGLDVESGDIVLATALSGIEYRYQVC